MKSYMIIFLLLVTGPGLCLDFSNFNTSGCDHHSGVFEATIIATVQDEEHTNKVIMSAGCNWPIITQEGVDLGNDKVRWGREYNVFIDLSGEHPVVSFDAKFSNLVSRKELHGIGEYPVTSVSSARNIFILTEPSMDFDFKVGDHNVVLKIKTLTLKKVSNDGWYFDKDKASTGQGISIKVEEG